MSAELQIKTAHSTDANGMTPIIQFLERLDNFFHVLVAVMFILMAAAVLVHTSIVFVRQVPFVIPHQGGSEAKQTEIEGSNSTQPHDATDTPVAEVSGKEKTTDPFLHGSLETLSSLLFIVIILELLRTILTYLQTHNVQAIMREFIVVGIISSVRKILLVGAESSLAGTKGVDFIQEAVGTLLTIFGIMVLVFSLWIMERSIGGKKGEAHPK